MTINMGHPRGKAGPAAQLNSRGQHIHTRNPHQYTNYQEIASNASQDIIKPQPTHPIVSQQKSTWVHTTMGWKKNPFL